jgi:adenosylcobalamin-dependent ribonucleoside-diphosphate reductase
MNTKTITDEESTTETKTPIKSVDESLTVTERLTDNAVHGILPSRYLTKNEAGETTEDISGMFRRVAENVAGAELSEPAEEKWADEFEKQMTELRFMPNSPTLMNAGTDMNQLSACFVLEPEDDMESIFENAKDAALVFQSGGGVGYAFSHLRPKGAYIGSTGGEASGPVSFMRVFDETCNQVKQGGKRRGAQMGILRADHPDVGRFITAKRDEGELSNFNISVGVTDEFIDAVKNDDDYTLYSPEADYDEPYEVREATAQFYDPSYQDNPEDAYGEGKGAPVASNLWRDYADEIETIEGVSLREKWEGRISLNEGEPMELPARFIWDVMIDGAYQNGEPGLFNFSESNRQHSFDTEKHPEKQMNATNPCAEQMLMEHEACNLGHINLSLVLQDEATTFDEYKKAAHHRTPPKQLVHDYVRAAVDFSELDRTIEAGVRFLDNVVTQSDFPVDEIEETVSNNRKIGLGIMGFAQMLYQMGIPYGSEDSFEVARFIMRYIDRRGTDYSNTLAKERGVFGEWEQSKYADPQAYPEWFEDHTGLPASDYPEGYRIRNHNITTIAPTGTTSMIGDTSGGCEPVYNVANFKNVGDDIQGDDVLVEFDDYFLRTLDANGIDREKIKQQAERLMRDDEFDGVHDLNVPEEIAKIFVTTQDVAPKDHGRMQRAFQEFVDSGISKTVNLPNSATRNDVDDSYMLAFADDEVGASIKGLTVYRDGSRDEQVLTTRMDNKLDEDGDNRQQLRALYESDEVSDVAAAQLGLIEEKVCPDCGEGTLEDTDDCAVCPECFFSPCS